MHTEKKERKRKVELAVCEAEIRGERAQGEEKREMRANRGGGGGCTPDHRKGWHGPV